MRTRLYIQKKTSSKSKSTPVTNQFQSRPFAPPTKALPQQQPDLQAQQEKPKGLGHSLANISITNRNGAGRLPIQTKLTIGQPGDKYEQEADRVAAKVVNQINSPVAQKSQTEKIQRDELPEEDELMMKPESGIIQREEIAEDDEELQMKSVATQRGTATPDLETSIQQARSSGQPLTNEIRTKMESAFGTDFNGVKIHSDAQSDQLNRSIQARAFTTGQDIFFRQGTYNPESRGGQELLAHELTHVVQQSGGTTKTNPDQTVQRLYDIDTFKNKTFAVGSRNNSQITAIDTALIAYNNTTYDDVNKLGNLQALRALCPPFLTGRIVRRKSGVKKLLAQSNIELPVVTALNDAVNEANEVQKVEKLRRAEDLWLANQDNWRGLPNGPAKARDAGSALYDLWQGIETDLNVNRAAYDGVTQNDYNKLLALAGDPNLPNVTRDTLNEIISIVGPLITGGQLDLMLNRTSGAWKDAGGYKVKGAARQGAGSSAALASLAHELTHITVDQTFNNTFMMSIAQADEVHIQQEGVHRTGLTNALKAARGSLLTLLNTQQMGEVNNKLDYMSDQNQLVQYVDRAKAYPVQSGVTTARSGQIEGYVAAGAGNVGNNMVEYDAVITQLLVLMYQWNIPTNNQFYTELRRVAQDAYDYRVAVGGGDPQGGRNR
ncbi:MAG: DUF4157 domain-containing protein [Potamolinea sp.]